MPFERRSMQITRVWKNLPPHGEALYRKTFMNAQRQYGTLEQAHRVAWSAIKLFYRQQNDGRWQLKSIL